VDKRQSTPVVAKVWSIRLHRVLASWTTRGGSPAVVRYRPVNVDGGTLLIVAQAKDLVLNLVARPRACMPLDHPLGGEVGFDSIPNLSDTVSVPQPIRALGPKAKAF